MDDWDHLLASSESLVQGVAIRRLCSVKSVMHVNHTSKSRALCQSTPVEYACTRAISSSCHVCAGSAWNAKGQPYYGQQLSERIVSRIQHRDTTTDGLASARLLAQQGVNQRQYVSIADILHRKSTLCHSCMLKLPPAHFCRLSKALSKFEMKATYEDVYQTQHPNVEEYLKHVQQATLLSAIHV